MNIAELVSESEALIQWLDQRIDGVEIKSEERLRLAAGCLDVALEHQKAIVLLVSRYLYGSAFSLVRLIFESYVRGVWLHSCASDSELARFKAGKLDKTFGTLIQELEQLDGFNVGVLSAAKNAWWNAMNSFTHSGYLQVVRRNTEITIQPNYTEGETLEALNFANAVGVLSAIAIALLAENTELASSLLEKAKALCQTEP
jgi:hypothetical protein